MNFSLIVNLKKLVEGFRNFNIDLVPELLRTVADVFAESKEILEAFLKPTPFGDQGEFAVLTDAELATAVEQVYSESHEGYAFNPAWIPLIVELISRLLKKKN